MLFLRRLSIGVAMAAILSPSSIAVAQPGGGPAPVRFTEARLGEVRATVELTGTVESRRTSIVASEVSGKVISLEVREGERVGRGAPLVRLRRENLQLSLDAARAGLEEAQARLELAQANLTRARDLHREEVVSRQILDDAVSEEEAARARVAALRADMGRLEDDLERSTIRAPFSGVVIEEHTQVGEWVAPGSPIVEIMDVGELEITVDAPERHFGALREGAEVQVTVEALSALPVVGTIRAVVPKADARSRTFPVKVRISNDQGEIGVGMLARVRLPVGESAQAVLVPKDAIVESPAGTVVYVIESDRKAQPVPVQTGSAQGSWIAVEGDVKAGDEVVTRGNERLRPGAEVRGERLEYPER